MPRSKKSAHEQLDKHREKVASENMKLRELGEQRARTEAGLERIADTLAAAYASEDQDAIRKARQAKEDLMSRMEDLDHRVAGAELRAQRARGELDSFLAENAGDLLAEREEAANRVAAELTEAVAAVVKARHAYDNERQHVDQLVSRAPGATTRYDGTPASYPWERELKALERAYRENPEAEPPRPRWAGVTHRRNVDAVHSRLQKQRAKRTDESLVRG